MSWLVGGSFANESCIYRESIAHLSHCTKSPSDVVFSVVCAPSYGSGKNRIFISCSGRYDVRWVMEESYILGAANDG